VLTGRCRNSPNQQRAGEKAILGIKGELQHCNLKSFKRSKDEANSMK